MKFKWKLKPFDTSDKTKQLAKELNVDLVIANLLLQRNVNTFEEARDFFRPDLKMLHDPYLMKDMGKAIGRIETAVSKGEKVLIYGDYDVDGTTAVALVFSFFRNIVNPSSIDFYIPDRYNEGYGVSLKGIDFAADNGFSLIIALDCGIKANDKIDYANSKGIDFIICDHHLPGDVIPEAFAVLDPKQHDCPYPYKELSGCGVGFKLIQAYAQKNKMDFRQFEKFLDLVVISIASDIVAITGENRIMAYYGLKLLNSNPRPAIQALLSYSNVRKKNEDNITGPSDTGFFSKDLTINDLVFLVGPRINAAGRVSEGRFSVELLIAKDVDKIQDLAEIINANNTERRTLDSNATEDALAMIANDAFLKNSKSSVLLNENWHKGIIGIVASRLTEVYYRPTIVCTRTNGLVTGSARSVKDFDIYAAIDYCSDLLEDFGGHKFAAGLSMKAENFEKFRQKFEKFVTENITEEMMHPVIEIDANLNLRNITPKFNRVLKQFAPFGPGNMSPVFLTENVYDEGKARVVGTNHLKLSLTEEISHLIHFDGIAFQKGQHLAYVRKGLPFSICYHVEENCWKGNVSIQLNIKDIKIPDFS